MNKEKPNSRSIWDYIKAIGAFGILLSVFSFGFSLAGAWWSSTISNLNMELTNTRTLLNKTQEELSAVKQDYMEFISESDVPGFEMRDSISKADTTDGNISRTIDLQKTESFFNDDLTISLVAIPFEGDPQRHMVVANITSEDGSVLELKNKDVGTSFEFGKKTKYQITITEIETFSATFAIRRQE
jgi:hypothetical protein